MEVMRPLQHPSIQDVSVEAVLHALSDPVRVQIFADLQRSECPLTCSNFLNLDHRTLPKSTLSQHFKILREAGLIHSERKGVEMHSTSRCQELQARFGPMIRAIVEAYQCQAAKTKTKKKR